MQNFLGTFDFLGRRSNSSAKSRSVKENEDEQKERIVEIIGRPAYTSFEKDKEYLMKVIKGSSSAANIGPSDGTEIQRDGRDDGPQSAYKSFKQKRKKTS